MSKVLNIRPVNWFIRVVDALMVPVMYLVSGTFREKPNRTFAWNIEKFPLDEARYLDKGGMVQCEPVTGVPRHHWWSMLFNMPIAGGWRKYVVLTPSLSRGQYMLGKWRIGWVVEASTSDYAKIEVSRILLNVAVRMLLGPSRVSFFGISDDGTQIPLVKIGEGFIGGGGAYKDIPLL